LILRACRRVVFLRTANIQTILTTSIICGQYTSIEQFMTEPIIEIRFQINDDSIQLEWGMTVTDDHKWQWTHPSLEVRLFCDPFPNLGKPQLLNTPIEHRSSTYGLTFDVPFLPFSATREATASSFRPGTVFASPAGKCYPVTLQLSDQDIPTDGVICYPLLKWPVEIKDWLKSSHLFWVQFGYTQDDSFIEVMQQTFQQKPDMPKSAVLPDISVPDAERPRHRAASPKIFISYSRHNLYTVQPIVRRLGDEFGFDVWIDYDSIPGGDNWKEAIARGVHEADRMLFMMSAASCASEWCRAEIEYAVKQSVKVIPVRIATDAAPVDLSKVGLNADINIRDMNAPDIWTHLINDLPEVMARNRLLLDPVVRRKHLDYLRSLYKRLGYVSLIELFDQAPRERVRLMDIYVRLKLGISFNLEVKNGEYVDWWLREHKASSASDEPTSDREMQKPKSIKGFTPRGEGLKAWEKRMREVWAREKGGIYEKDGTYYWKRIESEVAPALMPYVVITGAPGSGKSTLLKHLALCLADDLLIDEDQASLDTLDFWPHKPYTPVFIELRALIRTAFASIDERVTLEKVLHYIDAEQLKPYGINGYVLSSAGIQTDAPLRQQMRDGDVMFFLDGLDEVPNGAEKERREQIKAIVRELRGAFPDCPIAITSRPHAYAGDWQIEDFGQVTLAPLDADRLEELALRLFQVVLGPESAEIQTEAFQQAVTKVDDELRQTPLFFTLMAQIWLDRQDLPPEERLQMMSRGAIFRECVDMLIRRWTRKDLSGSSVAERVGLDEAQLRALLAQLAYRVHKQVGNHDDAVFEAGEVLNTIMSMHLGKIDPYELIDALAQRAGVLYAPDTAKFQFAHRNIQEYLAAQVLVTSDDFPANVVQIAREPGDLWRAVLDLLPDELSRERLWMLVKALLPGKDALLPDAPDDSLWRGVYHAVRWMHTYELPDDADLRSIWRKRAAQMLTRLVACGALIPTGRAEVGRILGTFGDPRPGVDLHTDGLPDIAWCNVPAGLFTMGSNKSHDENASDSELSQHEVTLAAFQIAKYPVTNAQFAPFVNGDGYTNRAYWTDAGWQRKERKSWTEPPYWKEESWNRPNHPVVGVSWYEAYAYCQWLGTQLKAEVWLPTESEWEKAARGTDERIYPYGDDFDPTKGNNNETGIGQTSAVGIFPDGASPFGVLDMSGNVWEWCGTKWRGNYETAANDGTAGNAPRVLRGGSFDDYIHFVRATWRDWLAPHGRYYILQYLRQFGKQR
jgi:formylglycine-generating enzyme required for sulfatase activity